MKYALISPTEQTLDSEGNVVGARVAEVATDTFDVAQPLFWVECEDDVAADQYYYADGVIQPIAVAP